MEFSTNFYILSYGEELVVTLGETLPGSGKTHAAFAMEPYCEVRI